MITLIQKKNILLSFTYNYYVTIQITGMHDVYILGKLCFNFIHTNSVNAIEHEKIIITYKNGYSSILSLE